MPNFSSTDIVQLLADNIIGATIVEIHSAAKQQSKSAQRITQYLLKLEQEKIIKYCDVAKRYQCLHANTQSIGKAVNDLENQRRKAIGVIEVEFRHQLNKLQVQCNHCWQYDQRAGEGLNCQICGAWTPED